MARANPQPLHCPTGTFPTSASSSLHSTGFEFEKLAAASLHRGLAAVGLAHHRSRRRAVLEWTRGGGGTRTRQADPVQPGRGGHDEGCTSHRVLRPPPAKPSAVYMYCRGSRLAGSPPSTSGSGADPSPERRIRQGGTDRSDASQAGPLVRASRFGCAARPGPGLGPVFQFQFPFPFPSLLHPSSPPLPFPPHSSPRAASLPTAAPQ